jgi:DNA repair exonuclease SbcCD ATPase subunit
MLQDYRDHISSKIVERKVYQQELDKTNKELSLSEEQYQNLIKARFVIAEVAKQTQGKFVSYVESMGTLAVKSVFDRDFKFLINFELKRNKSECTLMIQEGDQEPFIPSTELGGGVLDVISFALRIILWSLQNPRTRNTILLDEPFRFLGDLTPLAGTMLRELSRKMNLQFIITTHSPELAEFADRSWNVTLENGTSVVTPDFEEEKSKIIRRKRIGN